MKKNKILLRRAAVVMTIAMIISAFWPSTIAQANSAPSAPVPLTVSLKNVSEKPYYVSFAANTPRPLAKSDYHQAEKEEIDAKEKTKEEAELEKIFREKFSEEGYYQWAFPQDCSENDTYVWKYSYAETIKMLLYFPESDTFLVSQAVTLEEMENVYIINVEKQQNGLVKVGQISTTWHHVLTLLMRMIFTISLELLIAFGMGFRGKTVFVFLLVTNIITQIFLNVILLWIWSYIIPWMPFVSILILEICIVGIEIVAYKKILPKWQKPTDKVIDVVPYVIVANIASYLLGIILSSTFSTWATNILYNLI